MMADSEASKHMEDVDMHQGHLLADEAVPASMHALKGKRGRPDDTVIRADANGLHIPVHLIKGYTSALGQELIDLSGVKFTIDGIPAPPRWEQEMEGASLSLAAPGVCTLVKSVIVKMQGYKVASATIEDDTENSGWTLHCDLATAYSTKQWHTAVAYKLQAVAESYKGQPNCWCAPIIVKPSEKQNKIEAYPHARPIQFGVLVVDLKAKVVNGRRPPPGRVYPVVPFEGTADDGYFSAGRLDVMGNGSHWANDGSIRILVSSACQLRNNMFPLMPFEEFQALTAGAETATHLIASRLNVCALEEAYAFMYKRFREANVETTNAHYMLLGKETASGRPRNRSRGKKKKDTHPIQFPTRDEWDLRAVAAWPGLLDFLVERNKSNPHDEQTVSRDMVLGYLLTVTGHRPKLVAKGIDLGQGKGGDKASVHHIIAENNGGVDHPLNYYVLEQSPNSALRDKLEHRDANGQVTHMKDIVGPYWFYLAKAFCEAYNWAQKLGTKPTLEQLIKCSREDAEERMAKDTQKEK